MEQLQNIQKEIADRLQAIDIELASIEESTFDPANAKDAMAVVLRRSKLRQERESLVLRQEVVKKALIDAERDAAESRVTAISTEMNALADQAQTETMEFDQLIARVKALIASAADRRLTFTELRDEALYLSTKHDLDNPRLPHLPIPNVEPLPLIHREGAAALLSRTHTTWSIKRDQLKEERNAATNHQQPLQPTVSFHRESGATVLSRQRNGEPQITRPMNTMRALLED